MKKFEVTTLEKLNAGDRFYFLGDKGKRVFEKFATDGLIGFVRSVRGGNLFKKPAHKQVVFLTSIYDRKEP